jgi:hypothetical protein|tara:strand:- start:699 stop:863 length:165 start_codon:yes stop_codon:yes gene_type:complete
MKKLFRIQRRQAFKRWVKWWLSSPRYNEMKAEEGLMMGLLGAILGLLICAEYLF